MLNVTMIDGFGQSVDASRSKNPQARAIFKEVKKVIEYVNKSPSAKVCIRV
jgi:hypothetical protein